MLRTNMELHALPAQLAMLEAAGTTSATKVPMHLALASVSVDPCLHA